MNIIVGDLLTIDGEKYITLGILTYEGNNYAFVNKITDLEEATDEFYIFEILNDSIKIVVDEKIKNILIPKFQKMLEDNIKKLIAE